ncbi:MAG: STAS domain-containing protein [Phycisphaerae bacterium]|nr:STAS domain-containing protein [Phycisphaerae bacterium]MDW8262171.1 STAS domain-containing protein [Phycisphaerales bacterium]
MPVEKWSEKISIVHLGTDPQFTDDLVGLESALARGMTDVILDFTGVQFLNSSNLSRLLRLRKSLVEGGRRLVLCGLSTKVWGAFIVTGLDKVFEFSEAVPTALATLQLER